MTYAVEFKSAWLVTIPQAQDLAEFCRTRLRRLSWQGVVGVEPGYFDEWNKQQRVYGASWGHFLSRDEAEVYAKEIRDLLSPAIDPDAIGPIGYEGKGCGEVNWDKVEVIR